MSSMSLLCGFRAAVVALAMAVVSSVASARPAASPEDVYEAYLDRVGVQIEAAENKLDSQYLKADQTVQRLIDREAPDAAIARAMNSAINGIARTIRSATTGLNKTALGAKRTLTRMQTAAERREDFDTATQAEAFIAEIDDDIADFSAASDEAVAALAESLRAVAGSEELAFDYAVISDELFSNIEDYVSALLDDLALEDDSDDETEE